eukprot:TRINITY_DN2208_c0_g1_i2.p1 TRINITY_DN2208_c0_g1~~TRINITY_DN2208_c0_g1_i2.p1  ORF type:complete len:281 (-),score=31.58 TRINITY_DN2208_c0_g1_i2:56-898(-)
MTMDSPVLTPTLSDISFLSAPSSLNAFDHTVAGSTSFFSSRVTPGVVFKPVQNLEKSFYQTVSQFPLLQSLVPRFYGAISSGSSEFLILEDLTFGHEQPCIMDIKLGIVHHDLPPYYESHHPHVRANGEVRKSKYITAPLLGFCLSGMQVYKNGSVKTLTKEESRLLTADTVRDALYDFFHDGVQLRLDAIQTCLARLRRCEQYFQDQPPFHMRSSSLLFLYDSTPSASRPENADVRLIDHAHARLFSSFLPSDVSPPVDQYGYLMGIRNLISILESLMI